MIWKEEKNMSIFYKKLSQVETSSTMGFGLQNCDLFSLLKWQIVASILQFLGFAATAATF